jgi:putative endonuclease
MNTPLAPHLSTGFNGEDLAVEHLHQQGYRIVQRNLRMGKAEIDVIARKDGLLVFVEVKTRTNDSFGYPEEFVNRRKQRLILNAADTYIQKIGWQDDIRFDIIAITLSSPPDLFHIEDAFH